MSRDSWPSTKFNLEITALSIRILEEPSSALAGYGTIPIAFKVETRYRVEPVNRGLGGLKLVEEKVPSPYLKDYDQDPGEGPASWGEFRDISHWGILSAFQGTERAGGTVVAWRTPGINPMEGGEEVATLLDIRIAAAHRRRGVGSKLFAKAVEWARARNCRLLIAETQNVNVPACKFYAAQGCELRCIHVGAYPDHPEEVQLLWYKVL